MINFFMFVTVSRLNKRQARRLIAFGSSVSFDLPRFSILLLLYADLFLDRQVFLTRLRFAMRLVHVPLVGRHLRRFVVG